MLLRSLTRSLRRISLAAACQNGRQSPDCVMCDDDYLMDGWCTPFIDTRGLRHVSFTGAATSFRHRGRVQQSDADGHGSQEDSGRRPAAMHVR